MTKLTIIWSLVDIRTKLEKYCYNEINYDLSMKHKVHKGLMENIQNLNTTCKYSLGFIYKFIKTEKNK